MKHLNQIHRQLATGAVSLESFAAPAIVATPVTEIAQEGFRDAVRDFFTAKLQPYHVMEVRTAVDTMMNSSRSFGGFTPFDSNTSLAVMRFIYKDGNQSNNLPADMRTEARYLAGFNDIFGKAIAALKSAEKNQESTEHGIQFRKLIADTVASLNGLVMLNNFYATVDEKSAGGGQWSDDDKIKATFSPSELKPAAILVGLISYYFDRKAANKNLIKSNEILEKVSASDFKSATLAMANELKKSALLMGTFMTELDRIGKRDDNRQTRAIIRMCHNLGGTISEIAGGYTPFFRYAV